MDVEQHRHLELQTRCGSDEHLVLSRLDDVAERVTAGSEHVLFTLSQLDHFTLLHENRQFLGRTTCFISNRALELFTETERQFPRILLGRTMAVRALDLDLSQSGTGNVAVAMHID